jgi:hypothetical protein
MSETLTTTVKSATVVKKVVVGTPVKRVNQQTLVAEMDNIGNVNTSSKTDGSVLVYNASSEEWESTLTLEKQNVNGGQY